MSQIEGLMAQLEDVHDNSSFAKILSLLSISLSSEFAFRKSFYNFYFTFI